MSSNDKIIDAYYYILDEKIWIIKIKENNILKTQKAEVERYSYAEFKTNPEFKKLRNSEGRHIKKIADLDDGWYDINIEFLGEDSPFKLFELLPFAN